MKSIERWFYLAGIGLLAILLLYNWKCVGACPEVTVENKTDTLYLPSLDTGSFTWTRPQPKQIIKKPKTKIKIDSTGNIFTIDTNNNVEIIDVDDLLAYKLYDTTFTFQNGEVRVLTEIEKNNIMRQEVTPSLSVMKITNTEIKTITSYKNIKKDWSIGIQGGYGLTFRQKQAELRPYFGIGIQRNLFSFNLKKKK